MIEDEDEDDDEKDSNSARTTSLYFLIAFRD